MILNKRIKREFFGNWFRYGALFFLIVFSISIVVSMATATDSIFYTIDVNHEKNHIEDGEFKVFVQFSPDQIKDIEKLGVKLEEKFYVDVDIDGSIIRFFKNRKFINTVNLDEGELADAANEIVLEKHYAAYKGLKLGDTTVIKDKEYVVTGIGSAPDYAAVKKTPYDVTSDIKKFSIAFVSDSAFEELLNNNSDVELCYSYILEKNIKDKKLKDYLVDIEFDKSMIKNQYMKELVNRLEGKKQDLKDGINKLSDGSAELKKGADNLTNGAGAIKNGAYELKNGAYDISEGANDLKNGAYDVAEGANDLANGVKDLKNGTNDLKNGANDLKNGVNSLKDGQKSLKEGLGDLNDEIGNMSPETGKLYEGSSDLYESSEDLARGSSELYRAGNDLYKGSGEIYKGSSELYRNSNELYKGSNDFYYGCIDYYYGCQDFYEKSKDLYSGNKELAGKAGELNEGLKEMRSALSDFIDENMEGDYENLYYFVSRADNPRINDVKADSEINKLSALFAGVIILLLLAYMISIFIAHTIEKESAVIGALYSLGYIKKDLLKHFIMLPIILVVSASAIGTVLGYALVPVMNEASNLYSFPELQIAMKPYIIVYGLLLPVIIATIVNLFIINRKLSLEPLRLLRKEKKQSNVAKIDLGNMSFINRYRIRQLLREMGGNITIIIGLFLAILLMVFSFEIKGSIDNYVERTTKDAKFEHMYVLQYPKEDVPEGGEKAYSESLYAYLDILGSDLEINILGIKEDNPYFYFNVDEDGDTNDVYISNSVANKFGYKVGDNIVLNDHIENKSYMFYVAGIVPYANGLYIFANLDNMLEIFGKDDDYYNTVLSNKELNIEKGRVSSDISLNDLAESASKINDVMAGLIVILLSGSILIFILVLYLLLKMMIDKATFSISLIKVFGYTEKEVKKLYLGSVFYTVFLASAIGIPVSKLIVDFIWPYMISNVPAGFDGFIPVSFYIIIIGIISLSYLVVNFMAGRHLKKVSLVEILKDRE